MAEKKFYITRRLDGHTEYLISGRWTRNKAKSDRFETRVEAKKRLEQLFGPTPAKTYGTFPQVGPIMV